MSESLRILQLYPKADYFTGANSPAPSQTVGTSGQVASSPTEEKMVDFVDGKYDVLVCTTIIESGLDIPTANTMLIDRAEMYGLSQLYQLRGRVGRSDKAASCWLSPPPARLAHDSPARRTSARTSAGVLISARPMETRCCCPPESWLGNRSFLPTIWKRSSVSATAAAPTGRWRA